MQELSLLVMDEGQQYGTDKELGTRHTSCLVVTLFTTSLRMLSSLSVFFVCGCVFLFVLLF